MLGKTVAATLLLGLLAGCSSSQPAKTPETPPAQPSVAVASPPTAAAPAKDTAPPAKPATTEPVPQKKAQAKAKAESGSPMDRFAKCLSEKDATMYGVFWCDHCREQKEKFGESFKYVKYVECVTPDAPRTLIPECKAQGITHTPTWIFSDGLRIEGAQPLQVLADKTGCKAP